MPRYELIKGASRKFWEIAFWGMSFTTTYGRIGTIGQSTTKKFASEIEASRQHERLIAEKVRKGYKLIGGKPTRRGSDRKKAKRGSRKLPWGRGNPRYDALVAAFTRSQEEAGALARAQRERFRKLPSRVERPLGWDALESEIRKQFPKKAAARKPVKSVAGLATPPPSFVEFVSRFRDTGEWRLIYRKRQWPPVFNLMKPDPKWKASLNSMYDTEAPRKAARFRALIMFATDASQTSFCWDPAVIDKRGEPPIYAADTKHPYGIRRLGNDLLDVIQHYRPAT